MNKDKEFEQETIRYLNELILDISELEETILEIVNAVETQSIIKKIKRQIHSIKGSAGGYGFDLISVICHKFEDSLTFFETQPPDKDSQITTLLKFKDAILAAAQAFVEKNERELKRIKDEYGIISSGETQNEVISKSVVQQRRVLIVETSMLIQKNIIQALLAYDLELSIVKDGYEALGRLLHEKYDIIITSMQLPTITGCDLLKILSEIPNPNKNIKKIILTSSNTQQKSMPIKDAYYIEKNATLTFELQNRIKDFASLKPIEVVFEYNKPAKIILIDDAHDIHTLVDIAFKKYPSVKIEHCKKPEDAENTCIKFNPDLILLDVLMPNISGEEVLKKIRLHPALEKTPVVFLTGTDRDKEVDRLTLLGTVVIKKPFSVKTLAQVLLSLIEKK